MARPSCPLPASHRPLVTGLQPCHACTRSLLFHSIPQGPAHAVCPLSGGRVLSLLMASLCDSPWCLTDRPRILPQAQAQCLSHEASLLIQPKGQEPSDLKPMWLTSWEAWVVSPSQAASCNPHEVSALQEQLWSSTVLYRTRSFVQTPKALTAPPSDRSQARVSALMRRASQDQRWSTVTYLRSTSAVRVCF